jgi:hypothetical protein
MVVRCHQEIVGLDVTVYHLFVVNLADRAENLKNEPFALDEAQSWNFVQDFFPQTVVDVLSVSVKHDNTALLDLVKLEHQDIWMFSKVEFLADSRHFFHDVRLIQEQVVVREELGYNLSLTFFEAHKSVDILSIDHSFTIT